MLRKYAVIILNVIFIFNIIFWIGCATTQQSTKDDTLVGDVADIDQLLGLSEEKKTDEETVDEDDVMKLLGVVEDKDDISKEADENKTAPSEEEAAMSYNESIPQTEAASSSLSFEQQNKAVKTTEQKSFDWKTTSFTNRYKEALDFYQSKKYHEAIQRFEALLVVDRNHALSDNCQYWIGESYFGLGSYQQAIVAFQKVFSFEKSNKNDAAQLKLGICYMKLGDKEKARTEFQKLIDDYPSSEYNGVARRLIKETQ
jgi:tol-pal system protein YbgF